MSEKPRRLGRGLEALISGASTAPAAAPPAAPAAESPLRRVPITRIRPNPFQPRKEFREDELVELQESLRANGLLQPITVRPAGNAFELIAGERRLRAATRLGWSDIPAIVKELDDRAMLTLALVENLQRADLNPIEEAEGYTRLIAEFEITQQQVAEIVGKDRSTIANSLRLLNLPTQVRRMLQDGQLTVGHARALLALPNERVILDLAREAVAKKLSVRDVERRVKQASPERRRKEAEHPQSSGARAAQIRHITDALRRRLQTDVTLDVNEKDRGEIRIVFYSADDLQRLIELIGGQPSEDM